MENTFFGSKHNRIIGSVALVALIVTLCTVSYGAIQESKYGGPMSISVTGEAEVTAVPDVAKFSFTVTEKGVDGTTAQNAASTKSNQIISALKEAGVEEKDIKSDNYNLYPLYRYDQTLCPETVSYCPGEQIEDGFEASQSFRVTVRNKDKAGDLLVVVGDKGAINLSSLDFAIDNDDAVKSQARAMAIVDAKAKAKVLAENLGVRIIEMVGYYEDEGYADPYYGYGMGDSMMKVESAVSESPVLPAGENIVTSRVNITYQVK